jgi:tetratricopeptide (TPR) repeat protein
MFFVVSCATLEERNPLSYLDTPEHHTYAGFQLLDQGKYPDAEREFNLAIQLNPKFSMAYGGSGLVQAFRGEYDDAYDMMQEAERCAQDKDEKVFAAVGKIRLLTMQKGKSDWLEHAEKQFNAAIALNPKSSAAYFFMGLAYKYGLEYVQAGNAFAKVLDLNDEYLEQANDEWRLIQKIQQARPGTKTGKKIALLESLTRADAAALFIKELKLDILCGRQNSGTLYGNGPSPADIENHVLREDIEGILAIGIRGLDVYPDEAFHPNDLITRVSLATMIEDIIIKITGKDSLAQKFVGAVSPFSDLKNDHPGFNSVMVVTTRGIMRAKDPVTGRFSPLGAVSGVDALLTIRTLQDELRYF